MAATRMFCYQLVDSENNNIKGNRPSSVNLSPDSVVDQFLTAVWQSNKNTMLANGIDAPQLLVYKNISSLESPLGSFDSLDDDRLGTPTDLLIVMIPSPPLNETRKHERLFVRFAEKVLPSFELSKVDLLSWETLINAIKAHCQVSGKDYDLIFPRGLFVSHQTFSIGGFKAITSEKQLSGIVDGNREVMFYFAPNDGPVKEFVSDFSTQNNTREMYELGRIMDILKLPSKNIKNQFEAENAVGQMLKDVKSPQLLIIDEIQKCPLLVNWIIARMSYIETKLHVIFTGTPSPAFDEPVVLGENRQKIDNPLYLPPLSVLETYKLATRQYPGLTCLDFLKLWSLTGGIPRWIRSLIINNVIGDDLQMIKWLSAALQGFLVDLNSREQECFKKIHPNKRMEVANFPKDLRQTAESLKRRGALSSTVRNLEYGSDSHFYVIDNIMITSSYTLELGDMGNNSKNEQITEDVAKQKIHHICGLGLEDCITNLFFEVLLSIPRDPAIETKFTVDEFEFGGYMPMKIAFGKWDIDCVLAKQLFIEAEEVKHTSYRFISKLVLFSCKVSHNELLDLKKTIAFIKNNIYHHVKNLPFLNELTIVATTVDTDADIKQKILGIWQQAWKECKQLFSAQELSSQFDKRAEAKIPDEIKRRMKLFSEEIKVNILCISLVELINSARDFLERIEFYETCTNDWPIINRDIYKDFKITGKCSLLTGLRGVGKTTTCGILFPDAMFMSF